MNSSCVRDNYVIFKKEIGEDLVLFRVLGICEKEEAEGVKLELMKQHPSWLFFIDKRPSKEELKNEGIN